MPVTFAPVEPFHSYSERLNPFFKMKRENSIIEVRMHSNDDEALFGFELHRAFAQMFRAVGADRENEVMILTGTGDHWIRSVNKESFREQNASFAKTVYDTWYIDGSKLLEDFIWCLDIPVIGAVNGPGFHTECALLADITLCTPNARFVEPHFTMGLVPGDGKFLVLQELLGMKRANKVMYLGHGITADEALNWGLVTEVVPQGKLLDYAWAMARYLLNRPREVRGLTTAVARHRWKTLLTRDLSMHLSHEIFGALVDHEPHEHMPIEDFVDGKAGHFVME